jgi:hypothetical protein
MKNFAGQPVQGGMMNVLTGLNLTTEIAPGQIFLKRPLFIDNCKNCNNMKNFTDYGYIGNDDSGDQYGYGGGDYGYSTPKGGGGFLGGLFDGIKLGDVVKIAGQIYSNEQQIKLAREQGKITEEQAAKARLELQKLKATEDKSSIIKSYGLPIAIGGVVIIAGIATYFYFKKKNIK